MALNIDRLKQAKKEKGLSYDDLARLTGYSRSTITNIFCGYIELPRYETIQAIEKALGLAPSFTEADKALGAGNAAIVLSDRDLNTLGRINRAEEVLGEAYVDAVLDLLDSNVEKKLKGLK